MDSLTGIPTLDALIPVAQQLIGAVRTNDADAMDEAFAEAIIATGGTVDPCQALAVLLAAMVPDDQRPSELLEWMSVDAGYRLLLGKGILPDIAREVVGYKNRTAA
ncbi:hypothetical protein [Amycolatopsis sp. NPDC001319]|uniref:hypothetical protein n=1 Tax=unclassified Amycolatopsis TaxID=2618356 RepID=UPI003692D07B